MADAIIPQGGIYQIRNIVNGKVYIGSAVNLTAREKAHRFHLARNTHHAVKLQRAWNKYGADAFTIEVIERVADKAQLIQREQHWINKHAPHKYGYNSAPTAGSNLGVKFSADTRAKIGAAHKGMKHTAESKARMSQSKRGSKYPPRSAEHCAKISQNQHGRKLSPACIEKIRIAKIGQTPSAETRLKMSQAQKNIAPEVRERMNLANRERGFTEDGLRRLSAAAKGRKLSDATKEKIRQSKRGVKLSPEHLRRRHETRLANVALRGGRY